MRVTYLLDTRTWGGAEEYVISLIRHLPDEVEAVVVATRPSPPRLRASLPPGVVLHEVEPVRRKGDLVALLRLFRAVRATRPDVVHVNLNAPANNRYGLLAARLLPATALATLHLPVQVRSRVQRGVLRWLYRGLDALVVVSEEARVLVVDLLGVPSSRVHRLANGVRLPPHPTPRPGRVDGEGPVVVGALGRLVPEKGFDVLVEAVARLVTTGDHVRVLIGGAGPEHERLQQQAAGLPVSFLGEVADPSAFLRDVDVFCLPSRHEGLPLALMEAMAAGLPCVATDVGDVAAALGSAVLVVPPERPDALAEALRELLRTPAVRVDLARRGRMLVAERHDVRTMAATVVSRYEAAMLSRRCRRGRLRRPRPGPGPADSTAVASAPRRGPWPG